MTTLSDSVWNTLRLTEGFSTTIYSDTKGIPTIGLGFALLTSSGGNYYLRESWDNLKNTFINMGISDPTILSNIKTALEEAKDNLNGISNINPFPTSISSPSVAAQYGSVDETAFKNCAWPNIYEQYLTLSKNSVGINIWNSLSISEQTALYSLVYNSPSLIGGGIKNALVLYNNGENSDAKFIGKMEVWNQILYKSNAGNEYGVQNRRFLEANEWMGVSSSVLPNANNASSVINVSNIKETNIVIAFMNQSYKNIINKLKNIPNYNSNPYDYIRDNFSEAIEKIFFYNDYKGSYDLSKLFTEWNLLTDLTINTVDGSTSYGTVTGTDLKDIIFLTSNQDNSKANGGDGDDEIYGNLYNTNILYGNGGSDIIKAGMKNDTVDGGYIEDTSEHANKILLGAGSDIYNGGIGKDIVDGGSKESEIYDYIKDGIGFDVSTDINNIHLGGGSDKYFGGDGRDIVNGGSAADTSDDTNHIYLGGGSDEYIGGVGNDIVDGGSKEDTKNDKNRIYLGDGNNVYFGGKGEDTVYGGEKESSKSSNKILLGGGNDTYYGGAGIDEVDGGSIEDGILDINKIYLGEGSDKYTGGIGKDIVDGGSREDKNTDINEIDLGFGDDEYRGGIGKDIVNGGSGIDKIYAGDGNNDINGGIGNDTILTGKDNDIIYGGTGRNFISAGSGNNEIHCDINSENLININSSSGVDKIYNSKNTSYIYFYNGISRTETVGNDIVIYGRSGNIAILYGAAESEDENDKPKLYDEDGGIYGWDPQSGGYKKGDDKVPGIKEAIDNQSFDEFQEKKEIGENIPEDIYKDLNEDQLGNLRDLLYEDYLNGINGDGEGCGRRAKYGLSDMRRIIGSYLINSDFSLGMDREAIRRIMNRDIIRGDPLVLDLDGDGVETTGLGSNVFFDHDKNGFAENSGWVKGDDGILVRDINQNGKIDDGSELFGNNSVLLSGQKADNGFEALKDLDSNSKHPHHSTPNGCVYISA